MSVKSWSCLRDLTLFFLSPVYLPELGTDLAVPVDETKEWDNEESTPRHFDWTEQEDCSPTLISVGRSLSSSSRISDMIDELRALFFALRISCSRFS